MYFHRNQFVDLILYKSMEIEISGNPQWEILYYSWWFVCVKKTRGGTTPPIMGPNPRITPFLYYPRSPRQFLHDRSARIMTVLRSSIRTFPSSTILELNFVIGVFFPKHPRIRPHLIRCPAVLRPGNCTSAGTRVLAQLFVGLCKTSFVPRPGAQPWLLAVTVIPDTCGKTERMPSRDRISGSGK